MRGAGNAYIKAVLPGVADRQCLGCTLGGRVTGADYHRVYIAAVILCKGSSVALSIHFSGRYVDELAQPVLPAIVQKIVNSIDIAFHDAYRVGGIKAGRSSAGSIDDVMEIYIRCQRLCDIETQEVEGRIIEIGRSALVLLRPAA